MTAHRMSSGVAIAALFLFSISSSFFVLPAQASTASSQYDKPTWWAKFEFVSSPNFTPDRQPASTKSVTVGPNIDVSNEPGPQSETSVSINPDNPSGIVAGSNEIFRLPMRAYFSSDGGKTWGGVDLPLPPPIVNSNIDFGSDPGVSWDTQGNVFYSYIVVFFNKGFNAVTGTEMAVARSSNGGQTWTSTYFALQTGTSRFNDKPMITVDTTMGSRFLNTVYAAWDEINSGDSTHNGLLVSHSSDGGLTFSAPVFASSTSPGAKADIGADPFTSPDGTLNVAWHDILNNILVESSSKDRGVTFGPTHPIAPTRVAFDVAIPAMSSRRALLYPACGSDTSNGPNRGFLYCSWMDETANNGADIFLSRSTDGGVTWSAPLRVNDDPTGVANDQFNQWLAVDPTDGTIHMSWYDTRNDRTHVSTNVFYARSTDGGLSFSRNVQVTTAPTNESCCGADLGNQYGDYEGIAAFAGVAHPVWTDRRAAVVALDEEVFTAMVQSKL